jgi:hypothetical protein
MGWATTIVSRKEKGFSLPPCVHKDLKTHSVNNTAECEAGHFSSSNAGLECMAPYLFASILRHGVVFRRRNSLRNLVTWFINL